MRKYRQTRRYRSRAAALFLTAAMVVQAGAPAMAAPWYGEMMSAESVTGSGKKASPSEADREDGGTKATPSEAGKAEKATLSNAKKNSSILPNGSFEETSVTNAGWKWIWKDSIIPAGWGTWAATPGNQKILYEIVTDKDNAKEGNNYLRINSGDKTSRISINYPKLPVDPTLEYQCTFWLKAENLQVTSSNTSGFFVRLARVKKDDGKTELNVELPPIKKDTDGWVQYSLVTKGLPSSNTNGLQIDIFSEYMSGEIWLDDVKIVPLYGLSLDKKDVSIFTGATLQLEAVLTEGIEEEITWYSKNPEIASVDENGLVTAHKMGLTEIIAQTDELHEAVCRVSVEDADLRPYYKPIRENWRDRLTGNNMEDTEDEVYQAMMADLTETAQENWDSMKKGGNDRDLLWDDIDFTYRKQNVATNVTEGLGTGFSRIEQMATAYSAKGSVLYQNEDLKEDIIGALEWVYATMYNDNMDVTKDLYGNWWHWFIGMPQSLCNTVILMYDDLDPEFIEREAKTLENFNEDPKYRYHTVYGSKVQLDAANIVDTSLVSALRSSIGETAKPMNMAMESLMKTIGFTSEGNGYYEDGSYIDHENLAYNGGYGSTLLGSMEKLLFITAGSPWEVDSDKLTSIFQWIWNGIRPLYADGAMMDMTTGRGVARPSTNEHTVGKGLLKHISHLMSIAPEDERNALRTFARTEILAGMEYKEDYFTGMTVADMAAMKNIITDDSLGEDDEIYHKNFGVMDKAVYHGENFDLGISMYSKRTGNFEYGNKENKKGWHMSDGALYLYNGDQAHYADVYWPTVDPHRLAGITTDHTEGFIPSDDSWKPHTSTKNWAGGSSVLNQYGSVGMDFEGELPTGNISSLKAKKSWFTFPNGVAALGAGITSKEDKATETIVDNRKAMEDAANTVWVDGKEAELTVGDSAVMPASWALLEGNNGKQQNIGYYFPEETEISVLKETRTGNWKDINGAITAGSANDYEITRSYISFAVDHGTNPQNETYSYVLLPGRTPDEMAEFSENPEVTILANTPEVQAVGNTKYGVSGYNFWTACDPEDLPVSAKTPASVTLAEENGLITAGISNPTQNGKDTIIVLNSLYETVEAEDGVTAALQNGKTIITIEGAKDFGKTYTIVLESLDKKLAHWQSEIESATRAEKSNVEMILKEVQALDTAHFNEEQTLLITSVIEAAKEKLALMDSADEIMVPITGIDEVTYENADAVEELLKKYENLTEEEKSVLSESDQAKIRELLAGFQKEEIYTTADGIMVKAANGTMDVRTLFLLTNESDSIGIFQESLSGTAALLTLFRPELLLKGKNLSLNDHPVRVTAKAPAIESGQKGTLKLYRFVPAAKAQAAAAPEEVTHITNHDGTITFEINCDSIYGFALDKETAPEPEPDPDPQPDPVPDSKPSNDRDTSTSNVSDGTWILDTNGWWFKQYNGTWPSSQWKWIKGCWYHFNESGYMQTGWILDQNLWYYLKPDGSMAADEWIFYRDRWYYFNRSGEMAANTSVTWKNVVYHLGADGAMAE